MTRELSYSWYPKDWTYSDSTFSLTLAERGAYRELIDLAMMNNNNVKVEWDTWVRKWNTTEEEITDIVSKLSSKGLIELKGSNIFIPSCERRLSAKRNGSLGGKSTANSTAKGTAKGTPKEKEKEKVNSIIPTREEFYDFISETGRHDLDKQGLWDKIESWKENGWKDGYDKPIKNWKSKIRNQFKYNTIKLNKGLNIPL